MTLQPIFRKPGVCWTRLATLIADITGEVDFPYPLRTSLHNPQSTIKNQKSSTLHPQPSTQATALLICLLPGLLWAAPRTWDGEGADALASNPTNWNGDTAPTANDAIILDATSHKNMTWNMTNMTVASWTQSDYTGTVTIATVCGTTGFTNLTISGNCIISNGMWTHTANPAVNYEVNRLCVTIGGSLTVGSSAVINVAGKGYGAGRGPGNGNASSYGGRGN